MKRYKKLFFIVLTIIGLIIFILTVYNSHFFCTKPETKKQLIYTEPAMVWDEAFPLGNGLLGGLVWGDGNPLKISIDRTDLWDLRPVPDFSLPNYRYSVMKQWVAEGKIDDLREQYDYPYHKHAGPSKIPAGRIELSLGGTEFMKGTFNTSDGMTRIEFTDGSFADIFINAIYPVGLIRIKNKNIITPSLIAPDFGGEKNDIDSKATTSLSHLGYDKPVYMEGTDWTGYIQKGWDNFKFAVVLKWEKKDGIWLGAWSVSTMKEGNDVLQIALQNCENALNKGFIKGEKENRFWWNNYWGKADIQIPNKILQEQWYLEMYKFGAATRENTPPITLQGPWTADNGLLPPWKGDYHHDLNTELSYWPAYTGNHLEGGYGLINWLWETKPNAEEWTNQFYERPGLAVPGVTDLNIRPMGGWNQYSHSSTTAGWLSHHFYLHWRYTMDREFLKERAYPWIKDVAVFFENITEKSADGKRSLPLSASPEINDNHLHAWFKSITNYDLSLIRWTFEKTAELANELGKSDEAKHWQSLLAEMPDYAINPNSKKLLLSMDYPLEHSHRHHSHLIAIHPLGSITWEGGFEQQKIIKSSLADIKRLGTSEWVGYSFPWIANLYARAKDGENAEKALEIFAKAFCLRNSFHANGDQSGEGHSRFTYRPFTLEGNFAFAAAIHEMLLQSYSSIIEVFPAVPNSWSDISFHTLRAEGAFLISAMRKGGKTEKVEIISEKGGICRIKNPFGKDLCRVKTSWGINKQFNEEIIEITFPENGKMKMSEE